MEVTRLQIKKFLDTGASVVEHAEEHVITFSMPGQTIGLCQQVSEFLFTQVAQNGADRFLCGYGQNRAAQSGQRWPPARDVTKEGLDRCQPCISRPGSVTPIALQISQEVQHQWTREILDGEFIDGTSAPCRSKL